VEFESREEEKLIEKEVAKKRKIEVGEMVGYLRRSVGEREREEVRKEKGVVKRGGRF
jgi:hypothetical protein